MFFDPADDPQSVGDVWDPETDVDATAPDSVDLVVEAAAMIAVFAAQQLERIDALRREALAAADELRFGSREIAERSVRLEVAAALRSSEYAAGELIARAEALVHRFPQMLASLRAARTTEQHARIFVDAMVGVEAHFHDRIVPRAIALAEDEAAGVFRRSLKRLIESVRADTLAQRHEAALARRRVVLQDDDDGMAWLSVYAPAVEVHAIHSRLTAMGKAIARAEGETRTLDQIRADIAGDLLVDGETSHLAPEARGVRASVSVTVPVLTLLDESNAAADSAVVEGIGPIPIARARELSGGAEGWTRVLTHPETGIVLSVGRDQYRPPESLRRLVRWRAARCMAPGCGMPASRCEIDHTVAWHDGGATSLTNLAPLCKGHHTVKHHGRWRVEQIPDSGGALAWTSPTGRRYRVEPERRVPVFRASVDDLPPF
jgi:hypothetical protein